jgi:hypothetical protein
MKNKPCPVDSIISNLQALTSQTLQVPDGNDVTAGDRHPTLTLSDSQLVIRGVRRMNGALT